MAIKVNVPMTVRQVALFDRLMHSHKLQCESFIVRNGTRQSERTKARQEIELIDDMLFNEEAARLSHAVTMQAEIRRLDGEAPVSEDEAVETFVGAADILNIEYSEPDQCWWVYVSHVPWMGTSFYVGDPDVAIEINGLRLEVPSP